MSTDSKSPKSFSAALEETGAEGMEILTSEPSRLARATIILLSFLLVSIFIWSFIGRADVIIKANGQLGPESETRHVYVPIGGELVDLYVAEGAPVEKDALIARINSIAAIEAASRALDMKLRLISAEEEYKKFPATKQVMEQRAESIKQQIEVEKQKQERRLSEDMAKLTESHKLKLEKAQTELEKARAERNHANQEMQKYLRLSKLEGGGGVSKTKVEEKRNEYRQKNAAMKLAENQLAGIEIELKNERTKKRNELLDKSQQLKTLEVEYQNQLIKIETDETRVRTSLEMSRQSARGAARITFDNIDEDNFLRIKAPVSGVITSLNFKEPGIQIKPAQPIVGIAPEDTRLVLFIEINEQNRGLIKEGLPVKMKFSAFPYQNHGVIKGTLEYISPSTRISQVTKKPVYRGRVSLDRDYFKVSGAKYPLRYGMTAIAEVVVRKRRLIDLALDPLRKINA